MSRDRSLDIAVTGLSARFPGSSDHDEWWSSILAGSVLTTRFTPSELLDAGVPEYLRNDPNYVPVRGYLADADRFDNGLFAVSPRDAEMMDPQHRLMLEAAWNAMEDAGAAPLGDGPATGVYASGSGSGYLRSMLSRAPLDPETLDQALHGTEPDFIASLISYKLGLTGPAVAVQTACSSSLVGLHLAVQALLNGDCDQAVVVAAGIDFPQAGHLHVPGGIHSASGECRPFDENADGVLAGSGVACVVLRRLADALEEGLEPYGVVLGTAINNDGADKAGYYAPSVSGQHAVICAALQAADVDAASIGYLEAHGTGTRIGDPIEWSAASTALDRMGAAPGQVALGALKANIGHLDAASGLASLIKVMRVLKEGVVPPVAGFTRMNPLLEAEGSPLFVPAEARPWTGPEPRRAGISSFGIGGTNAHVVVEQPPSPAAVPRGAHGPERMVVLSAADPEALARGAERLGAHLASAGPDLADVAFTLATGRAALPERLAVTGHCTAEVARRLADEAEVVRGRAPTGGPAPVVFAFPGQGSQYPGMVAAFAEVLPGFSDTLERCLESFGPELAGRLRPALLDPEFPEAELAATELAQPALFALEYAAARALSGLGLTPAALVGHSLGEITAACVAGVFEPADAARFVAVRGRAMQACPPGAMLALGCDEVSALDLVAESGAALELAAVNGPDACVVAGPADAVRAFRSWLGTRVFAKVLRTSHAFHSPLIEPAVPRLASALAGIETRRAAVPFAANLTGRLIDAGATVEPEMFVAQARRPVRYADAIAAIAGRFSGAVVVEVGPGHALSTMAEAAGLTAVPLNRADAASGAKELLTALGILWTTGQPIAPAALCGADGGLLHLPGYSFAGPRWLAPEARPAGLAKAAAGPKDAAVPSGTETADDSGTPDEAADPAALVAGLWTQLLGHDGLDDDSDFFELGGDSLLVTRLARAVNKELGVRVSLREMLASRTLGRQTAIVRELLKKADAPLKTNI